MWEFTGEFPSQRPVTRSFDVFFDLNKRLSKQSWGWWFEPPFSSLWRHHNEEEETEEDEVDDGDGSDVDDDGDEDDDSDYDDGDEKCMKFDISKQWGGFRAYNTHTYAPTP